MDKSQEDRLAQEKIEREALDTALSSSSRVERFLLSAASSGSISSQYPTSRTNFQSTRPALGKTMIGEKPDRRSPDQGRSLQKA